MPAQPGAWFAWARGLATIEAHYGLLDSCPLKGWEASEGDTALEKALINFPCVLLSVPVLSERLSCFLSLTCSSPVAPFLVIFPGSPPVPVVPPA